MKNILIITYDWSPRNSIAVYRPYAWAKCWAGEGVSVTILTAKKCTYDEPLDLNLPAIAEVEVHEVAYRTSISSLKNKQKSKVKKIIFDYLKKNSSFIRQLIGINYDIRDRWANVATPKAIDICLQKKIDIVISTYGPRSCHFIASKIKENIPDIKWVADYRDLWSIRHNNKMTKNQLKKEKSLEKNTLRKADFLMTVSKPLADELSSFLKKDVATVFNGFDTNWDDVEKKLKSQSIRKFDKDNIDIAYTGMIYPGLRDPSPLFLAINNLIRTGKIRDNQIKIHFYGKRQPGLVKLVRENSAESFVQIHGHVTREVALDAQENADLLLLLESGKESARGVLTGKIFEYMVSGTPILSLGSGSDSAIAQIIRETGTGFACGNNIAHIESIILDALQGRGSKFYNPQIAEIRKYDRKNQARELLGVLESLPSPLNRCS